MAGWAVKNRLAAVNTLVRDGLSSGSCMAVLIAVCSSAGSRRRHDPHA
jgi:hypothetical protein